MTRGIARWAAVLLLAAPALAQDELPPPELPEVKLERVPPRFSYDFAVQIGYHEITYWKAEVEPWMGIGIRGEWGAHFGKHRIGPMFNVSTEGPIPVHMTLAAEPLFNWDWVPASNGGLAAGGAIGPALMLHHNQSTTDEITRFGVGPLVAARVGYSQGWTRVGRRLFAMLEPRFRMIQMPVGETTRWEPNPSITLVVGSGRGY